MTTTLRDAVSGVLIVAHWEDTSLLRSALLAEGLNAEDVRGPYTPEQLCYSRVVQCLVNHANAWRIAATRELPTIVMEGDFVPVRGFGNLPVPVPASRLEMSVAYLYACGPQIWDISCVDVARGHAGGMQALLMSPQVAQLLLSFFDEEIASVLAGEYRPWDSYLGFWLNRHGVESYIPYRHYGEHGGDPNPEHAAAGLRRPHRADVLQGRLAFQPAYARGSSVRFWYTRIGARLWGIARIATGRLYSLRDLAMAASKSDALRFALGRFFCQKPPEGCAEHFGRRL